MEGGVSILVGHAPQAVSWVPIAGIAVTALLGIVNLAWAAVISKQTRRRSTDDEFWFRKVIGPSVIDKAVEFSASWGAKLAAVRAIAGNSEETSAQVSKCKEEAEPILRGCVCLKLYGLDAYTVAAGHVDVMVDQITECLHAVSSPALEAADLERLLRNKQAALNDALIALLAQLRTLQKSF